MNPTRHLLLTAFLLAAASGAQAGNDRLETLLGPTLFEQAVFANTYVSAGAGDGLPIGAGHETVYGNILANSYVALGASSRVTGSIQSGSDLTTGSSAIILGNASAVGATTLGASSAVSGNLRSGDAVTLGASAQVVGTVHYGSAITNEAGVTSGAQFSDTPPPVVADAHQGVVDAQSRLDAMTGGTLLATGDIAADTTFTPGVYDVPGLLSVTAGTTITLDAQGQDGEFVFNVETYLVFGAGVDVVVENGTANTRVLWNATGGYVSLGANADIIGTILAHEYVSTGADSTVIGAGDSYGAVYSATSYVSIGAGATIGNDSPVGATPGPDLDYSPYPHVYADSDGLRSGHQ